mmetsp:Transcript_644/g.1539  ORF Transcript_644/g.1539 Transcript_644/m.1539 type:complete len:562 (+) Transcript_644:62-1747(+)
MPSFHRSNRAAVAGGVFTFILLRLRAVAAVAQLHRISKPSRNVLFLVADDLRPSLGAYGVDLGHTPNIDKLAEEGLTFTRAYTNYAFCAPSRNSFMSGRLPDTTRVWNFIDHFREEGVGDKWQSLPQFFKERGYHTAVAGKVYHVDQPPNSDYPLSWSVEPYNAAAATDDQDKEHDCVGETSKTVCAIDLSANESNVEKQLPDMRIREACIRALRDASEQASPFFIGCGFIRPHTPWIVPREFFERLPESLPEPQVKAFPKETPREAFSNHGALDGLLYGLRRTYQGDLTNLYRRAYHAAVSYVDDNVGRVLDALEELGHKDDTIVVLTSDHGYSLGEMSMWTKMTNFENALRVPLIARVPWMENSVGKQTKVLAELVDLYPTLTALAGLPTPRSQGEMINGTSLWSVFMNPANISVKKSALAQFAKPSLRNPNQVREALPRNEIELMGYTLRENRWRYTAWFEWDKHHEVPLHNKVVARELYDHHGDCPSCFDFEGDAHNLAEDPEMKATVRLMHRWLLNRIRVIPVENATEAPVTIRGPRRVRNRQTLSRKARTSRRAL